MPISVYINFNGNCRQAVEYYAKVFETEAPQLMTFGDAPPNPEGELPEAAKDLIMHTRLNINGSTVMFSDVFPGMPLVAGNNIILTVASGNMDKIKAWFTKLTEGGKVGMDLQETFWSKCYGSLTDKFGIEWQFNYDSQAG
ncbi:VOC family protein [Sporomusa aerivorans]|uniref:VOC family protein n=1 Tax=Sporomusa aerivorans TaxID=204936 RepID=UPI003529FAD3